MGFNKSEINNFFHIIKYNYLSLFIIISGFCGVCYHPEQQWPFELILSSGSLGQVEGM